MKANFLKKDKSSFAIGKNNSGVALLMAMFALVLMSFLAVEISYDTGVEYAIANKEVSRLKAYYAAKNAVEISLLRIKLFQKAKKAFGAQVPDPSMLDKIWQIPFFWPLQLEENKNNTRASREQMQEKVAQSFQDAMWTASIESEGSKIDINDLDSPSESLKKSTHQQLVQLIENRLNQDDEWARENRNQIRADEIVNNIADWISDSDTSLNGGDKASKYRDYGNVNLPPKQPFRTLDELRMVAGVSDEIFHLLSTQVTVYGIKGINVNHANKNILQSIDTLLTSEIADEIIKRRNDPQIGPFKKKEDFDGFLQSQGVDLAKFNEHKIPLLFDAEFNFRITAKGMAGGKAGQNASATREIIAIVYDFDRVKSRLKTLLATPTPSPTPNGQQQQGPQGAKPPSPTPSPSPSPTPEEDVIKKGRPRVVYWFED